ncbi:hypothetical protein [Bradyrhizobium genosp. P]|uniref:hypothetical protein n=1 Tax=Bradyrhizobium genosp. P TaxID=83641 RepID=UPI003CE6B03E
MSNLEALIYSLIDRYLSGGTGSIGGPRYHERHGLVTSYDPDKHLAKVMLWPEGQETGWLPIETAHTGNDYGIAIGLQPGDGKSTGDQVIVRHQEGDLESGKIVQRVHSDDEQPPKVQSGEIVIWTKFKQTEGKSPLGDDTSDGGSGGDNDEEPSGQGGYGAQIYFKNDGSLTHTDGNGAITVHDGKGNTTVTTK